MEVAVGIESMAIKRYRREKYIVATEKSLFSTSNLTGGAVQCLWPDVHILDWSLFKRTVWIYLL
jgi:hypothetical protein